MHFRATLAEIETEMPRAFGGAMVYLTTPGFHVRAPRSRSSCVSGTRSTSRLASTPRARSQRATTWRTPSCKAVVTTDVGPYEGLPATYEAIQVWANGQGFELYETIREDYWSDLKTTPAAEW
jgi:hypothetical protein